MNNEQKVKNVEDNLNKIYLIINNIKEEQESFKKNYIDDFQKKIFTYVETQLNNIENKIKKMNQQLKK